MPSATVGVEPRNASGSHMTGVEKTATCLTHLKHPDNVAVVCILVFWFFVLDVGVVMVDKSDVHATEYLTNQTWMLCLLAKILLTVELCKHTDRSGHSDCTSSGGGSPPRSGWWWEPCSLGCWGPSSSSPTWTPPSWTTCCRTKSTLWRKS